MTIEIVGVRREGQVELSVGQRGLEMGFTESYHILTDDIQTTFLDVMQYAVALDDEVVSLLGYVNGVQTNTLPFPNLTVHRDGVSVCKSLGGEQDPQNARKWTFTAQWSTNVTEGSSGQNGNPTIDPVTTIPLRETMHEMVSRTRSKDLIGRAYVNGAGNLYNPGLTVEEELPRWDFTQIDNSYVGVVASYADNYDDLTTSGTSRYAILTKFDSTSTPGTIWPPGVYFAASSTFAYYGPTDATVFYFNGSVNATPFLGFPAYTLLLKVRSSKVIKYFGVQKRVTDYSIVYDEQNHWDKPINAGPFFYARKMDDAGDDIVPAEYISYPYIYYSSDVETDSTDLSQEDAGPLGYRNKTLTYNDTTGKMEPPTFNIYDGFPVGDGVGTSATDRVKKVTLPNGKFTYRAVKSSTIKDFYHIEYVNHNLLDFNAYLRITQ